MLKQIMYITVLVHDQDAALAFYTEKLGFEKRSDDTTGNMRWLVVGPKEQQEIGITLIKAEAEEEKQAVGKQAGRYPIVIVTTDNCQKTYQELQAKGVKFVEPPMDNPWGMAVQFFDLYGNKLELVQPRS